jgi:thiol-disulfide isomerase/thioredoxin
MTLRRIGTAGLILALIGCSNDQSRNSLVENPSHAKTGNDSVEAVLAYKKGVDATNANKLDEAIKYFEEALRLDPENRKYILDFGRITQYRAGQLTDLNARYALFRRSAEVVRKLKAGGKTPSLAEKKLLGPVIYNEACADVHDHHPDKALALVRESIENGFEDLQTLTTDTALDSLRDKPEFARLVTKISESRLREFQSFPFTFELPDLEGKKVKLADYKGKVTIVDIWGTWCPPCRMEVPHFVALRDKYKDKDLEIIGINYERVGNDKIKGVIEAFVKEQKINYPCVLGDDKTQDQLPEFQGFPTTLFLDRKGKVRYVHVGYAPMADLEGIVKVLLDDKS